MKHRELGCFQKSRTCWLANFLDSIVGNPEDKPGGFPVQTRFAKKEAGKGVIREKASS